MLPISLSITQQRGITLIEVMIGLTIGLIIAAGMATMYSNVNHSRMELEKTGRQVENARYALDFLSNEIKHAGFYGYFYPESVNQAADPCAVEVAALGWTLTPDSPKAPVAIKEDKTAPCLTGRLDKVHGVVTDVLTVRHLSQSVVPKSAIGDEVYFQAVAHAVDSDKLGVLSRNKDDFVLLAANKAKSASRSDENNLAEIRQYQVSSYYIGSWNNSPTLMRATLAKEIVIEPIAEGVEQLQIYYAADGDNFVAAESVVDWTKIKAVQLYMLVRNREFSQGFQEIRTGYQLGGVSVTAPNDGFKRHVYSTTVYIRNSP